MSDLLLEAVNNLVDEIRLLREDLRPELKKTQMMVEKQIFVDSLLDGLRRRREQDADMEVSN